MKIASKLFTLFLVQQGLSSASAFAPVTVNNNAVGAFNTKKNTALKYRINESEQFREQKLTTTAKPENRDLKEYYRFKNYYWKDEVDQTEKQLTKRKKVRAEPEIGGTKKFDLEAAKRERSSRNIGAVRGAFQSLAKSNSIKHVQGGKCVKTWNLVDDDIDRVSVMLNNDGGVPLSGSVEVWQGPNSSPMKVHVASEDGCTYPFSAVLETPNKHNSIAVRNLSPMEFPIGACVVADVEDMKAGGNKRAGQGMVVQALSDLGEPYEVHGNNGVESFQFDNAVESIQILLKTDGRPLHARLELIQGPNDTKQVVDVFSENGLDQPFFAVIDTPSSFYMSAGSTVRVVNTAPSTVFPMQAIVEPYMVTESYKPPVKPDIKVDTSEDLFFLSSDDDEEEEHLF